MKQQSKWGKKQLWSLCIITKKIAGKKVTWTVNKAGKSVIAISKNGTIKGKKAGTAIIKGTYKKLSLKWKITVKEAGNLKVDGLYFTYPEDKIVLISNDDNTAIFGLPSNCTCVIVVGDVSDSAEVYGLDDPDDFDLEIIKDNWDENFEDGIREALLAMGLDGQAANVSSFSSINTLDGKLDTLVGMDRISFNDNNFTEQDYHFYQIVGDKLIYMCMTDLNDFDSDTFTKTYQLAFDILNSVQ